MTFNSVDDEWLKWVLGSLLWGYPNLVDFVFSEYADVRRRNTEQPQTRQKGREAGPAEQETSAELWAHAKAEDVHPEYMSQGSSWYALFDPGLERSLDVSLIHALTYHRCISFINSTV